MGTSARYSPEELERMVEEYFTDCEEKNIFPDAAGLRVYLGMSKQNYYRIINADTKAELNPDSVILPLLDKRILDINNIQDIIYTQQILGRARDRRESWLARRSTADGKLSKGCEFALKQPDNGGYRDKPAEDGPKELIVRINNGGSDPFA